MTQGNKPPRVLHGHTRPVPELNFSHNTDDGHFLVSACKDGKAMLRRGDNGEWIGTFDGHASACVWSIMLNKSATRAATGSADFTCKLWDALSGAELHSWPHNHIVRGVHFSMVSDKLATACHDKCIRIFDTAQPDKECVKFAGMRDAPRAAKLVDRDSCILLSYLSSSGLDVLDTRSGKIARSVPTSAPVTSMNISYDGQQVTTASASTVSVYDTKGMKLLGSLDAEQQVESASLDLSKGLLAVGGQDMWAYVLEWPTGKPVQTHKGHHGPIWSLQYAHDGESFATASEDGTVRVWYTGNASGNHSQ